VAAEVDREDEVAEAGEPARVGQPLAEIAVRLVGEDHRGRALAEAVPDELRLVGGVEPELAAADALVLGSLWGSARCRGGKGEQRDEEEDASHATKV